MTLDETLLQKLADWRPAAGRQTLNLPDAVAGWVVALTADRHDELGSLVWELTLDRKPAPAETARSLADWANGVAGQVTGLLEPLKVIEIDTLRNQALLRSDEPAQRSSKRYYYEILLTGDNRAGVRRYQAAEPVGGRREQVAFALTHEALAKLVADLAAAD